MKSFFIAFPFFLKNLCLNSLKSFLIWPNFFLSVFIFGFGSISVLSSSSDRFIMFILKHKRFFYVIKKKFLIIIVIIIIIIIIIVIIKIKIIITIIIIMIVIIIIILIITIIIIKTYKKNSLGRNWMSEHFLRPLPCVICTLPWLLRPVKFSTSSELYPNTRHFFFLNA